jgi:hypothetical protein
MCDRTLYDITQNWCGPPLVSYEVIVERTANTATRRGLSIRAELDTRSYPVGAKVRDEEPALVKVGPLTFHGHWNFVVSPLESDP